MKTNFKTNRKQTSGTILKSMIVMFIFIASATVNGQDFWTSTDNSIFRTASLEQHYESSAATAELTYFYTLSEIENEQPLELENWMTTEKTFGTFIDIQLETENSLELEEWMTNDKLFTGDYSFETEADATLQLEDWMKNESHFQVTKAEEKPLQLEAWMVADNFGRK